MSTFGERLRALRRERGINQTDLAGVLGISERALQNYETDEREPKLSFIKACADFLGVNSAYLVGDTDDPAPPTRHTMEADDFEKTTGLRLDPSLPAAEQEFVQWVKDHVTGTFFYDWHKSQNKAEYIESLRLLYKLERGRKPGQRQGE